MSETFDVRTSNKKSSLELFLQKKIYIIRYIKTFIFELTFNIKLFYRVCAMYKLGFTTSLRKEMPLVRRISR